jgi:hypothetical protein
MAGPHDRIDVLAFRAFPSEEIAGDVGANHITVDAGRKRRAEDHLGQTAED